MNAGAKGLRSLAKHLAVVSGLKPHKNSSYEVLRSDNTDDRLRNISGLTDAIEIAEPGIETRTHSLLWRKISMIPTGKPS